MGKLKGEATGELRDLTADSALRDGAGTTGLGALRLRVRAGKRKKKTLKLHQVSSTNAGNNSVSVLFCFLTGVEPQAQMTACSCFQRCSGGAKKMCFVSPSLTIINKNN